MESEKKKLRILKKIYREAHSEAFIKYRKIYDYSAAAVHDFYRAFYYISQLSGNDQDIMFPDPSIIFYDLWRLLYELIKWELELTATSGEKKGYDTVVNEVKKKLSDSNLRRDGTPANFYDFNNVKQRAIDALREVEQLGDISNRVRTDALRTRHFLADDYEDQRFHMDWTLVQMFGPAAGVLRHFVESASDALKKDESASAKPNVPITQLLS